MAALTVSDVVPAGLTYALAAAGGSGDTIADDGREQTYLAVANASGGSINVTLTAQTTTVNVPGVGAMTISDRVVAVANSTTKLIGPFSSAYRNASGNVAVSYSATTSVTVGAFRLPRVSI